MHSSEVVRRNRWWLVLVLTSAFLLGCRDTTDVVVIDDPSPQVAYVLISPTAVVLPTGQTRQFVARAFDADSSEVFGRPVTWSTDAPSNVSVNETGLVKALQHGYATIIATIDGKVAGVAVTVPEPAGGSTAAVLVTPGNTSVFTTSRLQLRARAVDLDGTTLPNRSIAWSSENPNIATVDGTGVVQGIAKGRARIRAIADGVIGYASVDVRNLPTGTQQFYSLAGTETLPSLYIDIGPAIWRDAAGLPHDARLVVRGGTLKFDLQAGTYERSFVVDTYLAEEDRLLVGTRVVSDQGKLYYDFETGAPLLVTAAGATQRAELRGAGEYSIAHSVLGQPGQKWVWIIE